MGKSSDGSCIVSYAFVGLMANNRLLNGWPPMFVLFVITCLCRQAGTNSGVKLQGELEQLAACSL
jgi:hypothetical protein